jgi:hypothetical protein
MEFLKTLPIFCCFYEMTVCSRHSLLSHDPQCFALGGEGVKQERKSLALSVREGRGYEKVDLALNSCRALVSLNFDNLRLISLIILLDSYKVFKI